MRRWFLSENVTGPGSAKMSYAHTLPDCGTESWEPLEDHLSAVESMAGRFSATLNPAAPILVEWGRTLGRWHDLGKYSNAFQAMLYEANGLEAHFEQQSGRVDHSTAGAQHAKESVPHIGRLLAYVLAGHHSGLADAAKLDGRLTKPIEPWHDNADVSLLDSPDLKNPPLALGHGDGKRVAFQLSLFIRMLFSCLIDADRTETESFCDPEKSHLRQVAISDVGLAQISKALEDRLAQFAESGEDSVVARCRAEVLAACRGAAEMPPGLFSLTVPTGGGKTLSSLAFALAHAQRYGLRRVITAIPFTSIIEQTASIYRDIFSDLPEGTVLEHHSNLDPENVTRQNNFAAENWDAPLIVTTNVQLLESLFACRTTPCRKLHRIARSVIVLDEAQTLPPSLLRPSLSLLRELVADYGCSIVLCTATQPALDYRDDFLIGLEGVREIVPKPERLYERMRRVTVQRLAGEGDNGTIDDDRLVDRLAVEPSWLTIVNTRAHAAKLYGDLRVPEETSPEDLFHLSTMMCAAHRNERFATVRQRLKEGIPCRVVSTQLVEAGVDVDFPVVFRAMAGMDSIAQAAGRCNREGKLPQNGILWLFDPAEVQPKGDLGDTAKTTRELLPDYPDPLDPEAVRRYFEMHYWQHGSGQLPEDRWDDYRVMECFPEEKGHFIYDFQKAADRYRLIRDASHTVFVPYGEGGRLIERLRSEGPSRKLLRQMQRYTVGLYDWVRQTLVTAGDIEILDSGYEVLANTDLYDENLGLRIDRPGQRDPETLTI